MNEYYRYKIKLTVNGLNKKSYPTYTVTDTSEEQAFKTILEHLNFEKKAHEVNYNPNWGYQLIKKWRIQC